jgi:hypothetical protein
VLQNEATYEAAKHALYKLIDGVPLQIQQLDRSVLEELAARNGGDCKTLEQMCVNYLRHSASGYGGIIGKLDRPDELGLSGIQRHVLHLERRSLKARARENVLNEIARHYPWLKGECQRQAWRDGVEEDPGKFVLPFGPFKGRELRYVETDYLIRLLGDGSVRRSFRTRIERHVAERIARQEGLIHELTNAGGWEGWSEYESVMAT